MKIKIKSKNFSPYLYNSSSHIAWLKHATNFQKNPNITGVLFGFHIALQKYFMKNILRISTFVQLLSDQFSQKNYQDQDFDDLNKVQWDEIVI